MSRKDKRYPMPTNYVKGMVPFLHEMAKNFLKGEEEWNDDREVVPGDTGLLAKVAKLKGNGEVKLTGEECRIIVRLTLKALLMMYKLEDMLRAKEESGLTKEDTTFLKLIDDYKPAFGAMVEDMTLTFPRLLPLTEIMRKTVRRVEASRRRLQADKANPILRPALDDNPVQPV